jgi:ABC-type sugar transport system ATPase subunit
MNRQIPLAIEATGLVKSFGETHAVDGVDLAVRSGSVLTAVFAPLTTHLYRTRS